MNLLGERGDLSPHQRAEGKHPHPGQLDKESKNCSSIPGPAVFQMKAISYNSLFAECDLEERCICCCRTERGQEAGTELLSSVEADMSLGTLKGRASDVWVTIQDPVSSCVRIQRTAGLGIDCLNSVQIPFGGLLLSEDLGMSLTNSVDFDSTPISSDQLT